MNKAMTLMELLVALILVSLVILYFSAIERIGSQDLLTTDRRAKVQNEVSHVLDHISTNITGRKKLVVDTYQIRGGAIGNTQTGSPPVATVNISECGTGNNGITIWIDYDNDGQLLSSQDKRIAYCYSSANYQIRYYSNYTDCSSGSSCYEIITGNRIRPAEFITSTIPYTGTYTTYIVYETTKNYLDVQITGCWDPDGTPYACGTTNNPSVVMHAYINMPSVSIN